jgi:hypothetical protein
LRLAFSLLVPSHAYCRCDPQGDINGALLGKPAVAPVLFDENEFFAIEKHMT